MQAIVLAAGLGSRLLPLTVTVPKPLVRLPEGGTILKHQLEALAELGTCNGVHIIAGYKVNDIRAAVAGFDDGQLHVHFNPAGYPISSSCHKML